MATSKITIRVLIDGVECYTGDADSKTKAWDQGEPVILDGLSFPWGRTSIVDQPDASTCSFALHQHITGAPDQVTLFGFIKAGAVIQVRSTAVSTGRDVIVWAGSITTADITQTGDLELEAAITATDPSTIIGNVDVGDEPWPQETAGARFDHITAAAGIQTAPFVPGPGWSWQLIGTMDETIESCQIVARDVDAQPPLDLLQNLAKSVGGVAWITADESGPVVWIEDPTQRKGLKQLQIDATTGKITVGQLTPELSDVNVIPAADIVRDPVTWTLDPSQSINIVQVSWQEPGPIDQDGNPTSNTRVTQAAETGAMTPSVLTVDTELADDSDANALAFHWLAIASTGSWVLSGLSIDTAALNRPLPDLDDAARLDRIMDLLDVRVRIGYRITITNLPGWAPGIVQSYHIEGGTYTWSDGRWQMELIASANAIGGGAQFNQFPPGTKISDFAGLKGRDLWGAAAPNLSAAVVPFTIPVLIQG